MPDDSQPEGLSYDPMTGVPPGWTGSPAASGLVNALALDAGSALHAVASAGLDVLRTPGDVYAGRYAPEDIPSVGRSYAGELASFGLEVPAPAGSLRMFGGPKAATADLGALERAKNMESAGSAPEDVWQASGWFRGADGRWKFEIPDAEAKWKPVEPASEFRLGDVLDHPALFQAYPDLANRKLLALPNSQQGDLLGAVSEQGELMLSPKLGREEGLSVVLHEMQHAIQEHEGFATGGLTSEFLPESFAANQQQANKALADATAGLNEAGVKPSVIYNLFQRLSGNPRYQISPEEADAVKQAGTDRLIQFRDAWNAKADVDSQRERAQQQYLRLAGEVEARNVQERHATGDYYSYPPLGPSIAGFPPSAQIVRFRGQHYSLVPVSHDPFAQVPGGGFTLEPVDHDPFTSQQGP